MILAHVAHFLSYSGMPTPPRSEAGQPNPTLPLSNNPFAMQDATFSMVFDSSQAVLHGRSRTGAVLESGRQSAVCVCVLQGEGAGLVTKIQGSWAGGFPLGLVCNHSTKHIFSRSKDLYLPSRCEQRTHPVEETYPLLG